MEGVETDHTEQILSQFLALYVLLILLKRQCAGAEVIHVKISPYARVQDQINSQRPFCLLLILVKTVELFVHYLKHR